MVLLNSIVTFVCTAVSEPLTAVPPFLFYAMTADWRSNVGDIGQRIINMITLIEFGQ